MSQPWQPQSQPNPPFGPQGYPPAQGYPPQPQGYPPVPGYPQPQGYPPQPQGYPPVPGYPQPQGYPPQPQGYPPQPAAGQAPLGQQPLPTNSITAYAAPKQRGPVLLAVVAALVLVGAIVAGALLQQRQLLNPPPAPPSPTATSSAPAGTMPFTMPSNARATGHWQILGRDWSTGGVTVNVSVTCDTEICSYGFAAFPHSGSVSVSPGTSSRRPELTTGTLRAGQTASGYVFLPMSRQEATLVLTTSAGHQMSALPIDV